jgi:hypothetical protein
VTKDLTIGMVDFGCVKRFDSDFVRRLYRRLPLTALRDGRKDHVELFAALQIGSDDAESQWLGQMADLACEIGRWFGRLCEEDYFDFGANHDFVQEGRRLMQKSFACRKGLKGINTRFVFLNRARYGLVRLFQLMEARVRIRNPYEYGEAE